MAGLSDFLFGTKDKLKKRSTMNPQQEQFLNSILGQLMQMQGQGGGYSNALGLLQDYLNPQSDIYQNFEKPYMQQFEQETVPMLAERFAGYGGGMGGGLSSSGFGQTLSAAGSNLQSQLAQLKSGVQQNAIQSLLGQYNTQSGLGLGVSPFAYQNKQGSSGFLAPFLGGFAGNYFGG